MSIFGKKKEVGLQIAPGKIKRYSDEQLYCMFTEQAWEKFTPETRLALLQEVENRNAAMTGRPAIRIEAMEAKAEYLGCCETKEEETVLKINSLFLKNGVIHTASGALATLLHEGRHAYQRYRVVHQLARMYKLSREETEWLISQACYMSPDDTQKSYYLYELQAIEMDARRYARREVQRIYEVLKKQGVEDLNFAVTLQHETAREKMLIDYIRKNFTLEELDELEQTILCKFAEKIKGVGVFKGLDLEGLRLFDNARLILSHPEITDLDELLDMIDRQADAKLTGPDEKSLQRIDESNVMKMRAANTVRIK